MGGWNSVIGNRGTLRWQTTDLYATAGFLRLEKDAMPHLFTVQYHLSTAIEAQWARIVLCDALLPRISSTGNRVTQLQVSQAEST